jgi:hypothetical protein
MQKKPIKELMVTMILLSWLKISESSES